MGRAPGRGQGAVCRTAALASLAAAAFGALLGLSGAPSCGADGGGAVPEKEWEPRRRAMVSLLRDYGVSDTNVLAAMSKVRRHAFIPEKYRNLSDAYADRPCPIGMGQTISQPFIVAYMTERLRPVRGEKVLEIGTGSGYQAAILAECGATVYSIEILDELAAHAAKVLRAEGYTNSVHVLAGDGYKGWPEQAPFDAIIVTCAPEDVPPALVSQLRDAGRMILPVGPAWSQRLVILAKKGGKVEVTEDLPVRFVPMVHGKEGAKGQRTR